MSYWKDSSKNTRPLDSYGLATSQTAGKGGNREFHELEFGVVLDIVLDLKHPIYSGAHPMQTRIDTKRWPVDLTDAPPSDGDPDLTWIGRALVRPLVSGKITEKDQLKWAYPLENNFTEYPLINETVVLYEQGGQMFYSRKVNFRNWPNNNIDFTIEGASSGTSNTVLFSKAPFTGRMESQTSWKADSGYHGYAGKYYYANPKIRTLHRFEGDLLLESRHGSEVIMKAFDKNRGNDVGDPKYPDYTNSGNPMLILRNRQRQLLKVGQTLSLKHSPNPATVVGTIEEKNVGGYLDENINHDGASVYLTCGQTISEWVTTCYKRMFHDEKDEEVAKFKGPSTFKYPNPMKGDQIVINSDRLVLSARYEEILSYSKKRYGICTDNEFTVDAHQQIVLTTHTKTVLNSPAIYLGEYDNTNEPILLGQTTVNWLYELCCWLLTHTHWHHHTHPDAKCTDGAGCDVKEEQPHQTQIPVQIHKLTMMRDSLHTLMSRRVFTVGGGFANGQDGASITEGTPPVKITIDNKNKTGGRDDVHAPDGIPQSPPTLATSPSTTGTPGTFKGMNYRMSTPEAQAKYGGAVDAAFGPGGAASDTPAGSDPSAPPQNDQQKIQALQQLPADQKAAVAKGTGCGGRRATQTGIFTPPAGQAPVTSSAEVATWNDREALLTAAGILEEDHNPPTNITVDDWKAAATTFK
jgi:hypothetical protein